MAGKGKGSGKKKGKSNSNKSKSSYRAPDPTLDCIFPREIVSNILSRLPVKTLLRFRCVCKPWQKLISKPCFITTHLNHHSSPLQNPNTIVLHTCNEESKDHVLSLFTPPDSSFVQLDNPYPFFFGDVVAGSCNGIVCLRGGDGITLWNPAMRQSMMVQLPRTKPRKGEYSYLSMVLAYDSQENVFVILSILNFDPEFKDAPDEVEICTSKTFTWKKVENELGFQIQCCCKATIKGVPYWIASTEDEHGSRDVLICFDVGRKAFDKLPMPGIRIGTKGHPVELKGSLGMVVYDKDDKSYLEVWVMDNEDGWSKKYNVGPLSGIDGILGCLRTGDIIAENDNSGVLMLIDPVTSSINVKEKLPFDCAKHGDSTFCNYTESLILIQGMLPVKKLTARDKLAREKFLKKPCPTCKRFGLSKCLGT